MRNSIPAVASAANASPFWVGHQSTTRRALNSIFERALNGGDFSVAERGLIMACEFWTAANGGILARHLGADATAHLYLVSAVFAAIGARDLAHAIDMACTDLAGLTDKSARRRYIMALESYVLTSDEPVDSLLARFAQRLAEAGGNTPPLARTPAYS